MDTPAALVVAQSLVSLVPAVVGYLAVRSLKQIDKKLDAVDTKISDLGKTDTEIKIELAELRIRVAYVELLVKGLVK